MIKILYIVSTLVRSGPTNQLFYMIKGLDKNKFKLSVLTLSSEPLDTMISAFINEGVEISSISKSRIQGLLYNKKLVLNEIVKSNPDIVHSQGLRADSIINAIKEKIPSKWVLTSHNYPYEDYPMKFGKIKGTLMAMSHLRVQRECSNVVACSKSIADKLNLHNVRSKPIRNGSPKTEFISNGSLPKGLTKPLFVSVGSFIKRKNMKTVIKAFDLYKDRGGHGSLLMLGDGPERKNVKSIHPRYVVFLGNVSNVDFYLSKSDCFISASYSEGMPNTVLESIQTKTGLILSDIAPHREVQEILSGYCYTFAPDCFEELADKLAYVEKYGVDCNSDEYKSLMMEFSSEHMSKEYSSFYCSLVS